MVNFVNKILSKSLTALFTRAGYTKEKAHSANCKNGPFLSYLFFGKDYAEACVDALSFASCWNFFSSIPFHPKL